MTYVIAAIALSMLLGDLSPAAASPSGITSITLARGSCLGVCADYTLTFTSKGCAHLDGNSNFALIGHFTREAIDFEDAVEAIESHHFFAGCS